MTIFSVHIHPITKEAAIRKFIKDIEHYFEDRKAAELRIEIKYEDGMYCMVTLPTFKADW